MCCVKVRKHLFHIGFHGWMLYVVFAIAALITIVLSNESNPLSVERIPADKGLETFFVKQGDVIQFDRRVCSEKLIEAVAYRSLKDRTTSREYSIATASYSTRKGCHSFNYNFIVPSNIPDGVYDYQPYLVYDINPVLTNYKLELPPLLIIVGDGYDDTL